MSSYHCSLLCIKRSWPIPQNRTHTSCGCEVTCKCCVIWGDCQCWQVVSAGECDPSSSTQRVCSPGGQSTDYLLCRVILGSAWTSCLIEKFKRISEARCGGTVACTCKSQHLRGGCRRIRSSRSFLATGEFKASLGYMGPCLKKQKPNKQIFWRVNTPGYRYSSWVLQGKGKICGLPVKVFSFYPNELDI